jgi:hypothetical protein
MDETKQPDRETKTPAEETAERKHPRMVTPDLELVDETRDRIAQRRPDPSDKPRKAPEQPRPDEPWFLHPDERREFKRLVETSRAYAAGVKGNRAFSQIPDELIADLVKATGEIEALCEALERCLQADRKMMAEVDRLTKENSGLLGTVARWQDYGEGRIPQPPADAVLPELPEGESQPEEQPAWEALYRRKLAECQQVQRELDQMQVELEKAREASATSPPAHVSYVVNFIAGRQAAGS